MKFIGIGDVRIHENAVDSIDFDLHTHHTTIPGDSIPFRSHLPDNTVAVFQGYWNGSSEDQRPKC